MPVTYPFQHVLRAAGVKSANPMKCIVRFNEMQWQRHSEPLVVLFGCCRVLVLSPRDHQMEGNAIGKVLDP